MLIPAWDLIVALSFAITVYLKAGYGFVFCLARPARFGMTTSYRQIPLVFQRWARGLLKEIGAGFTLCHK